MGWTWELLDGPDSITEGPVWDGAGLLYTAIDHNEIRRYDPASGSIATIYRDTGAANGLALAPDGRLFACEGKGRAVVAYDNIGRRTPLAEAFEGRRLNSPNDLVLDRQGRVWFTDPRYGDDHSDRELDHDSVYRLTPDSSGESWTIERMTFDTTRPNGLLLAPDEATLFVAQSDYDRNSVRQLRAYPVQADGSLGRYAVLHDFGDHRGIDGMCFDAAGDIVATCGWELGGPGCRIAIFSAGGDLVEEHPVPEGRPTNCAFGGADLSDLYVTTISGHLYRVANTGLRGMLQPPSRLPFLPA
ncbi:MAG: SMP-30/gluconolactonase/LRE family protein [Thermomicrobiales bacterium]|nr:SMP-30/gluconolactonase/LRE family protein [Thermomicrobiales bacterium]